MVIRKKKNAKKIKKRLDKEIIHAIVRIITVTGGKMNRYRQLANQRGQTLVEFAMMMIYSTIA